jgi:hypothetical protein
MRHLAVRVNGTDLCLRAVGEATALVVRSAFHGYAGAWDGVPPRLAERFPAVASARRGHARFARPIAASARGSAAPGAVQASYTPAPVDMAKAREPESLKVEP